MSMKIQITLISYFCFISFFSIISILNGVKELYLSRNEIKRRAKGQTFKERFLYSRYREEIPKILIWLYFTVLLIHPIAIACVCMAMIVEPLRDITSMLVIAVIIFDALWILIIWLISWKPGIRMPQYKQWVPKPKKKKKK